MVPRLTHIFPIPVSIAVFMSSLDTTIVNISIPTISEDLSINTVPVPWVVKGYLFMKCSLLPAFKMLGDIK
jgi:MFS family permease